MSHNTATSAPAAACSMPDWASVPWLLVRHTGALAVPGRACLAKLQKGCNAFANCSQEPADNVAEVEQSPTMPCCTDPVGRVLVVVPSREARYKLPGIDRRADLCRLAVSQHLGCPDWEYVESLKDLLVERTRLLADHSRNSLDRRPLKLSPEVLDSSRQSAQTHQNSKSHTQVGLEQHVIPVYVSKRMEICKCERKTWGPGQSGDFP